MAVVTFHHEQRHPGWYQDDAQHQHAYSGPEPRHALGYLLADGLVDLRDWYL
ncbi:MAG: hypothetical protein ABSB01_24850 [Streptosporangiaceae bacterium]